MQWVEWHECQELWDEWVELWHECQELRHEWQELTWMTGTLTWMTGTMTWITWRTWLLFCRWKVIWNVWQWQWHKLTITKLYSNDSRRLLVVSETDRESELVACRKGVNISLLYAKGKTTFDLICYSTNCVSQIVFPPDSLNVFLLLAAAAPIEAAAVE
jgi:hypothetical protein